MSENLIYLLYVTEKKCIFKLLQMKISIASFKTKLF